MIWLHKRGSWPEEIGFTFTLASPHCAMTTSWKEVTNYLNWVYTEIEIALVSYYYDAWLVSVIGATNQIQKLNQSRLGHSRFPAFKVVFVFLFWVLIASSRLPTFMLIGHSYFDLRVTTLNRKALMRIKSSPTLASVNSRSRRLISSRCLRFMVVMSSLNYIQGSAKEVFERSDQI